LLTLLLYIHIEIQARRERNFGERMAEYYMLLRLRHKLPVFPIVLYLEPGAGGIGKDRYVESLFGEAVFTFDYQRVGVPDLSANDYLQTNNALAFGLAALMKPDGRNAGEVKAECMLRLAQALVDQARTRLLMNCVEIYLPLDEGEQKIFLEITDQATHVEVQNMFDIFEIRAEQKMAITLLHHKFGSVPPEVEARVRGMQVQDELESLLKSIVDAKSLSDLKLDGDSSVSN